MAKTYLQTSQDEAAIYILCDGCRENLKIGLPMPISEFLKLTRAYEAQHAECPDRPITRCEYVDDVYGTCQHERNLTPLCGIEFCPLI